ncbi:MAG: glycosyltransferase [Deltaproteobacteria bacterium]|nr:glycosyltransferase [Deltaproteobacteria bacterium]
MSPRVSVVVSTFNRLPLLGELLDALGRQTLPADQFEVIVVDDGSKVPAAPVLAQRKDPFRLTVLTQANAGAAAARHAGIMKASGEVVVITDDDMLVPPEFLAEHLKAHDAGYTLVLGHIADDHSAIGDKPLFERFHADQINRFVARYRAHPDTVRGVSVCTGNVSFRREDYVRVGGFDRSLERSEDRELGVRLQESGARLYFAEKAYTTNRSDHTDLNVWMRRNYLYGVYDSRIAHKHPQRIDADPWHFFFLVNPVSRGLMLATVAAPKLGWALSRTAYLVAETVDKARTVAPALERVAIAGATLSYGLEYFRGVRAEAGSTRRALRDLGSHAWRRIKKGAPR